MLFTRIRIVIACILAYLLVHFGTARYYQDPSFFDTVRLNNDIQMVKSSLSSIQLPQIQFPTLITQQGGPAPTVSEYPQEQPLQPTMEYNQTPTSASVVQPTTIVSIPTSIQVRPTAVIPTTPLQPTSAPQPTKTPKPTKGPDLFPIDESLKRPGTTVDELFEIAAQKACIPKAVLRTIASIESGGFFTTVTPKYLALYNSWNWWNSEFITADDEGRKRVCSGYAYDSNTGLVFPDSKHAGERCRDGSGSGLGVAGCTQVSPREFELYAKNVKSALGVNTVDRRVVLDSLILTGFAIQKEVHATSCTNWSASEMVKGACSYYGSCGFKDGTYYCNTFCRNLKTFGGPDCSGAIAKYQNSCWN